MATIIPADDGFSRGVQQGQSLVNTWMSMKRFRQQAEASTNAAQRAQAADVRDEERLRLAQEKAGRDKQDHVRKQKSFVQDYESKNRALQIQNQTIQQNERTAFKAVQERQLAGFENQVTTAQTMLDQANIASKRLVATRGSSTIWSDDEKREFSDIQQLRAVANDLLIKGKSKITIKK